MENGRAGPREGVAEKEKLESNERPKRDSLTYEQKHQIKTGGNQNKKGKFTARRTHQEADRKINQK